VKELSAAAGFATTAVAGDEADAAQFDEVSETHLELFARDGEEELVGFDLVAEGMPGKTEVLAIHVKTPCAPVKTGMVL
jgi:hypothetical protein